ncbi:MAG: hypothetical protein LBC90_02635, partial [Candidatus Adiutrix sp.]|nr:hypothetical protein [Candidatus Adiutrix sp.]
MPKKIELPAIPRPERARRRLLKAAVKSPATLLIQYDNASDGYDEDKVEEMRDQFGLNIITRQPKATVFKRLWAAFVNPFTVVLFVLSLISFFSDDMAAVVIVMTMVIISGLLRFIQEWRSGRAAER